MADCLISIIIVNYNTQRHLETCLSSIYAQNYAHYEIIIVDNASCDNSVTFIREHFPAVDLIVLPHNTGFAAGNNAGLSQARGEYVFFLNPDTALDEKCLERLACAGVMYPESGAFAPKVKLMNVPDILQSVGQRIYPDGINRCQGYLEPDQGQFDAVDDVLSPSGAAAFYRKEVIDMVGGFDETFFMYGEDCDLGLRVRLAGWGAHAVPEAVVYHAGSVTIDMHSPQKVFLIERNRFFILCKLFPVSMIVLSPFYTLLRYSYTIVGMVKGTGPSGAFVKKHNPLMLLWALIKAWCLALIALPGIIQKRKKCNTIKKLSNKEIISLLKTHRISVSELTLKHE